MISKIYTSIILDIDNTLTKLQPVLDLMAAYKDVPEVSVDDVYDFQLANVYGMNLKEEQEFWYTCEPQIIEESEFSNERYRKIQRNFTDENTNVYIVSSRSPKYERATEQWLKKNNVQYDGLYCIGKQNKAQWIKEHLPPVDAVFEDDPYIFYDLWGTPYGQSIDTYCIDYPYNQHVPCDYRINRDTSLVTPWLEE